RRRYGPASGDPHLPIKVSAHTAGPIRGAPPQGSGSPDRRGRPRWYQRLRNGLPRDILQLSRGSAKEKKAWVLSSETAPGGAVSEKARTTGGSGPGNSAGPESPGRKWSCLCPGLRRKPWRRRLRKWEP